MKNKNSISKNDSRKYEEILTEFLIDKYKLPYNIDYYITQSSHDGGYDALFDIKNPNNKIVLMEAKLRSDINNDLKLSEFAKSFIIAINLPADIIYIGTNLHLSKNTITQLSKFQKYTGLNWEYIDPVTLFNWKGFYKLNTKETCNLYNLIIKSKDVFNKKSYLTSGEIKNTFVEKISESKIFSFMNIERENKSNELLNYLYSTNNIVIGVFGSVGNGKSFFINKTLEKLSKRQNNYQIIKIDLSNYNYPCILFINILEELWLTKRDLLYEEDWEDILEYILPNEFNKKALKKISKILNNNYAKEENDPILIDFLSKCLYKMSKKRNIIFYFENINKTSEVIIDFILSFSKQIKNFSKIIFEIRDSLYIDNKMSEKKWNDYVIAIKNLCEEKIYFNQLTENDIYRLIDDTINCKYSLSASLKSNIIKYLDFLPLIICNFISYLNIKYFNSDKQINDKLELEILQTLKNYHGSNYLDLSFATLSKRDISYSIIFYFAYLFDGEIPTELLKYYFNKYYKETLSYKIIINTLKDANLFIEFNGILKIKHLLLLECVDLDHHKNIMPNNRNEIAALLLKAFYELKISSDEVIQPKIKIFNEINEYLLSSNLNFKLALQMYKMGTYRLCYNYACQAYESIRKHSLYFENKRIGPTLLEMKILITIIQVSGFVKSDTYFYLKERVNKTKKLFEDNKSIFKKLSIYHNLYGHYSMILSRHYIHFGQYKDSYEIMKAAYDEISLNKHAPIDMRLHIVWEYAISLKHYKGIDSEINILKKWKKKYPQSDGLNIIYCSSMYSKYIFVNPKLAKKYCKMNILNKDMNDEIATHIHIDVHNFNIETVLKHYDTVETDILNIKKSIKQYGLNNELGRCYHILAFINSINGNNKTANKYYKKALNILDNKSYIEYIWTILLDYLVFCFENQFYNELDDIIYKFLDIIKNEYRYKIENIIPKKIEYSHIHMGIIIFLYELKKNNYNKIDYIEILKNSLNCKILEVFYNESFKAEVFKTLLNKTYYFHDNYLFSGC